MDARAQGLLLAAVLSLSIAIASVLRSRRTERSILFVLFTANLGLWYLFSFFVELTDDPMWLRLSLLAGVAIPQGGIRFFRAFLGSRLSRGSVLARVSAALGLIGVGLALSPWYDTVVVKSLLLAQGVGLMYAATSWLYRASRMVESRVESTRIKYLVFGGLVAITFSALDFIPAVGIPFPPVGTVLTVVFLYVLSQTLLRHRLLDLYELIGRFAVLTLLGLTLAGIFTGLVYWSEFSGQFFLNAVVAALVILILFDPLQSKVEEKIAEIFLRERVELEREVTATRAALINVFDVGQIGRVAMEGLERSRRCTHASIYIVSDDGQYYDRVSFLGQAPPLRLEIATTRPMHERLSRDGLVRSDILSREVAKEPGERAAKKASASAGLLELLGQMHANVILPLSSDEVPVGLLALGDDRLPEPYTDEDIQVFKPLVAQVGVAVENSHFYARMKERDRLAALGEMAAGLAHEIRNPLGAIKGAAQMLDTEEEATAEEEAEDFLSVIVEETNRLDRVVSTFLDYARPYKGNPEPLDVNNVVQRSMQVLSAGRDHNVEMVLQLTDDIPLVRADAERLHQVFMNLALNAIQAMNGAGTLTVQTEERPAGRRGKRRPMVDVRFSDTGPGIPGPAREKIFIPFYTTKPEGTGLGLPICQRIVQDMGGSIEVQSVEGRGATFVVSLPACDEAEIEAVLTATGQQRLEARPTGKAAGDPTPTSSRKQSDPLVKRA